MTRAAVAFPARGSYGPRSLGSLPAAHPWVRRADQLRADYDLPALSVLDGADRFDPAIHLRSAHASPLTFVCGLLDAERIAADHEVVVVIGSSGGWYTALAASGALEFDDAFRLVQTMALLAEEPIVEEDRGGQLIYALTDEGWQKDPARVDALDAILAREDGAVHRSLEMGAFTVVSGTATGITDLAAALPQIEIGSRQFPFRAAMQEAWHTPLRTTAAARAGELLADLSWSAPNVTLIDGRGARFTPWSADPAELARQTINEQPISTYDFALSLRVALREYAPEVILLPGPGASLAEVCAQLIVAEGYRGNRTRAELEATQAGGTPILLSMRR